MVVIPEVTIVDGEFFIGGKQIYSIDKEIAKRMSSITVENYCGEISVAFETSIKLPKKFVGTVHDFNKGGDAT